MSLRWNGKNPVVDCSKDKGFAVQADRDDADINKIIARFERSGQDIRLNSKEPFYGDVSQLGGLADSLRKVHEAQDLFMEYDANIRERFANDPVNFIAFLEDPRNYEEAVELGIVQPKPAAPLPPPAPGPEA